MNALSPALLQIVQIYHQENRPIGVVEQISCSGKWLSVFGSENQVGMAFNFSGEHAVYGNIDPLPLTKLQCFIGKNPVDLARHLENKSDILSLSLYLAVLNCLSNPLNNDYRLNKLGFVDSKCSVFDFVREEDFVTVIGAGGVIRQLGQRRNIIHVSGMRPQSSLISLVIGKEIAQYPENIVFHPVEDNADLLACSDIVFITGCALVNQTFFELMPLIKKARIVCLFGPSAMILPDYLASLGVDYVHTVRIVDRDIFLTNQTQRSKNNVESGVEYHLIKLKK